MEADLRRIVVLGLARRAAHRASLTLDPSERGRLRSHGRRTRKDPRPWPTMPRSRRWRRSCAGCPSSPPPRPGSGHPTSCMSAAEIMSVLFFDEMRWDPRDPSGRRADIFVLSKGHAAPVLWAALKESGAIDDDLMTLRRHDSRLEGHPTPLVPWVRVTTGSLGQGLSVAGGMAWARKLDGEQGRVYVLMGDGEVAEGSVWEAADSPTATGSPTSARSSTSTASARAGPPCTSTTPRCTSGGGSRSAGRRRSWTGTTWPRSRRCSRARGESSKPFGDRGAHAQGQGRLLRRGQGRLARQAAEEGRRARQGPGRAGRHEHHARRSSRATTRPSRKRAEGPIEITPAYEKGQEVATREAYGTALAKLAKSAPQVVALDGDTKNSTFSEQVQGGGPRALRGGLHRGAEHGGGGPGHVHGRQDPLRVHLRLLPDPRLRLHPHGRALAAQAPRALRQPRRGLDRRGRAVADGARGPGHDARAREVDRPLPERRRLRGEAGGGGRAHRRHRLHPHQPAQDARPLRRTTRPSRSADPRPCGGRTRTRSRSWARG